ncbi:MAG TPA: hypothetical protein VKY26_10875 [Actinomycetota bacterium]|nr:hypothetical protein [Actinomycetota bacterium]
MSRSRPLTEAESAAARLVFGTSLDLSRVRVGTSALIGAFARARTPFQTAWFPPGAIGSPGYLPWLIHELTHAWQTQHAVSFWTKLGWGLSTIVGNPYDFGGEAGLLAAAAAGKRFVDFNTEQQGDLCRSYYLTLTGGGDTGAFAPFIEELRSYGAGSSAGGAPAAGGGSDG